MKDFEIISYAEGLRQQAIARDCVIKESVAGILLLLEHSPVITAGRTSQNDSLISSLDNLARKGIELLHTDRGGDLTCHNPGQLVGYPVLNLRKWQEDVHWYVDRIEEVIIRALAKVAIQATRNSQYTGVWIGNNKVAAIGVSVRNWITGHGFALNVDNEMDIFSNIIPCGIKNSGVTNLRQEGSSATVPEMKLQIMQEFSAVFDINWV